MKILLILNLAIVAVSANIQSRIINGKDAVERQFPYQVGISLTKDFKSFTWCGGSLIGRAWVITAAHCTSGAISATLYLGTTQRSSSDVQFTVSYKNFIQHEDYNAKLLNNDIALIRIPRVTFNAYIKRVNLPPISSTYSYSNYIDNYAIASGWGKISDSHHQPLPSNLQFAYLKVIDNSECSRVYAAGLIKPTTLCAAPVQGTSICQGDSGGPLVLPNGPTLIGVTSFTASSGCEKGFPSGFTRVTSYLLWIRKHTGIYYK